MMQPARQILAIVGSGRFQPNSLRGRGHDRETLRVGGDLAGKQRQFEVGQQLAVSPSMPPAGRAP